VLPASLGQSLTEDPEVARELGEDQGLVALLPQLLQSRQQGLQLGAGLVAPARVEQSRVAGRLPQAQQSLQDHDLRPSQALPADLLEQRALVVQAQVLVEPPLLAFELAEERLLDLRGQLAGHLLLGAAQDERPQRARQEIPLLVAELPRTAAEDAGPPRHAWIEELEQAPELAQVVLDRGAGEGQPVLRPDQARRLGRIGAGVLDGLGLVQDGVVEAGLLEEQRVPAQRAIGGQHHVGLAEVGRLPGAGVPGVLEDPQLRREAQGLGLPVEDQRAGRHDQRGQLACARGASTCTVLPRPMSSARQPPKPKRSRKRIQPRPRRW
jgi:hypothetical protein